MKQTLFALLTSIIIITGKLNIFEKIVALYLMLTAYDLSDIKEDIRFLIGHQLSINEENTCDEEEK